jgi:DNA-binding winged helix-turn-helix (wHTH) protein
MDSGQFEFGAYRLDAQSQMLFREGGHVAMPPKAAELLVALVQAAGRVLTREELLRRLWPDTVVEEGSLTCRSPCCARLLASVRRRRTSSKLYQSAATGSSRR